MSLRLARAAIASRQALAGSLARRDEYTERTVLSRLSPFPLPEDAVVVIRNCTDEAARTERALIAKHQLQPPLNGRVVRVAPAPEKPAAADAPARRFAMPHDVYQDAFAALKQAVQTQDGATLYYLSKLASGVAKECRVPVAVATDDAVTAYFLQTMLARAPASAPAAKIAVSHSLTPDASSKTAYVGHCVEAAGVVARGRVPLMMLIDGIVALSARANEASAVLTFKGDVRGDKSGARTLVLGAPSLDASASAGTELLAAHHVAWSEAKGLLRVWDGAVNADKAAGAVQVAPGVKVSRISAATYPGPPTRVSFVLNADAKKSKPIDAARARSLLAEKFLVQGGALAGDKALEAIDKLLASSKPELLVFE